MPTNVGGSGTEIVTQPGLKTPKPVVRKGGGKK